MVKVVFVNGTLRTFSSSKPEYVINVSGDIKYVVFSYVVNSVNITYIVEPRHSSTMYLVVFPSWFRELTCSSVVAYSWHDYPWHDAPCGLEIMAGTEGAYVEESIAGRMFNLFYTFAYRHVHDILDKIGIKDLHTRYEIAATALWAAQLVREVKERPPNLALCYRAAKAILVRYFNCPRQLADIASYLILPMCNYVKYIDNVTLYKAILYAIKSVKNYIKVFPEWKKVDEEHWVKMCIRLQNYTVKPVIPTYAHALIAGAYIIYTINKLKTMTTLTTVTLATIITTITLTPSILYTLKTRKNTKPRQ